MSITIEHKDAKAKIIDQLDQAYVLSKSPEKIDLSEKVKSAIDVFSERIDKATTAFTNIVTCLSANACDDSIDPRFHRQSGEGMPENPTGVDNYFSGRSLSEKIIYPWLESKGYRNAKSGWQTRTFERTNPYYLDFPHNIKFVKNEFLFILDQVAKKNDNPIHVLAYFIFLEEKYKDERVDIVKKLAKNREVNDLTIHEIIDLFSKHFKEPDSSRLPTLAMYAAYLLLINEVKSYGDLKLLPLSAHVAADSRTKSLGDIELSDDNDDVVEALEIKHNILIDSVIVTKAKEKILKSEVKRYYILTTHKNCTNIDDETLRIINKIYKEHGCQVIINGIIPTIKYYLRLVQNPKEIIKFYSDLLTSDRSVKVHHITSWHALISDGDVID